MTAEVLPERAVLSTVVPASGGSWEQPFAVSDGHGATVYYACQHTHYEGTQGLLGFVGLGAPAYSSTVCMPAAIVSH